MSKQPSSVALDDHAERAHLAITIAQLGTWSYDPLTDCVTLDARMRALWGEPSAAPLPLATVLARIHPDDQLAVGNALAAALAGQDDGRYASEFRIVWPDGTLRWLATNGQAQFATAEAARRPIGFLGTALDITERTQVEHAVRASDERYRAFVANSSEGVYRIEFDPPIDPALPPEEQVVLAYHHGRFAECNDAFARMYGFERAAEMVGQRLDLMLPPDDAAARAYLCAVIEAGYHVTDVESVERDRQGQTVYFANSVTGVVEAGRLVRVWGVQRDITERTRRDLNATLLADLQDALAHLTSADELMHTVGTKLGAFLQVTSSFFAEVDHARDQVQLHHVWKTAAVPAMPGAFGVSAVLTDDLNRSFPFDEPMIVSDTETDPRLDPTLSRVMHMRAVLGVPFHRTGVWKAALIVCDSRARTWRSDEVELVQDVANRVFPRLERAHAEAALRESQARLQLALDAGTLGTFVWYPADDRTEPDARMLALFGLPTDGSISLASALAVLIHPADRDRYAQAVARALDPTGSGQLREDIRVVHPDGAERWLAVTAQVAFDDARPRRAVRMAGMVGDSTDRKRAEAALRESEERLRLLVESVQDYAIFTLDPAGRVTSWNAGAHRLKGYTADEILGQSVAHFYTPEAVAAGKPARELATALEAGRAEDESWRVRKDGSRFWGNEIITPLYAADGTQLGFTKITRDMTARKEAEAERERLLREADQARRAAEAAVQARDHFLAIASHELRTPMTTVLGYAELLQRKGAAGGAQDAQATRLANQVVRHARRLNSLLGQLFDVAQLERGQLALQRRVLDLGELVERVTEEVTLGLGDAGGTWPITLERAEGALLVDGDGERLEQVLTNLLSNAVKYSPDGGPIRIRVARQGTQVAVTVADEGIGIPEAAQAHLFDAYYRAPNVGAVRGFGIGLHVVQAIVERHGGQIAVESVDQQGSTFRVLLPLADLPV